MAARGPDGKGEWISGDCRIGFGHRRLSIVDLSEAGAQPMQSADGKLVVTFNGEIYNYRELRRRLESNGHVFQSHSDTEVLLHLYALEGEAMVHDLRGMFAFAIWDTERRSLFLARDPYGIKPLYYADDGWTFRFASQVKALLAGGAISRDSEPAGQVGFYIWGSVPEPYTMYKAIRVLPAGTRLIVDRIGSHKQNPYHSIAQVYCEAEAKARNSLHLSVMDAKAEIRAALIDSVRQHLVADVPIGAFLSGGIDSGALVGLMRDASRSDTQSVAITFEEFRGSDDDEAPIAAEVARRYCTRHTTRVIGETEFRADLPRIFEAMDQPSIDGINSWFVSKAAHEQGMKVAVSGLGGDELFGSYPSFRDIPRWVARASVLSRIPSFGRMLRKVLVATGLDKLTGSPKAVGALEFGGTYPGAYLLRRGLFMPWELHKILDAETVRVGMKRLKPLETVKATLYPEPRSDSARVAVLEASLYMRNQLLRDVDWASMAHSVEVRVPLVDTMLLRRLAPLTTGAAADPGKQALAAAPLQPLPHKVVARRKTGFVLPQPWLRATTDASKAGRVRGRGFYSRNWSRVVFASQSA